MLVHPGLSPARALAWLTDAARRSLAHGDRRDLLRLAHTLGLLTLATGDIAAGRALLARVAARAQAQGLHPLAAAARRVGTPTRRASPAQRAADAASRGGDHDTHASAALHRAEAEFGEGLASLAWACARDAVSRVHEAWSRLPDETLRRCYRDHRARFLARAASLVARLAAHPDVRTWAGDAAVDAVRATPRPRRAA